MKTHCAAPGMGQGLRPAPGYAGRERPTKGSGSWSRGAAGDIPRPGSRAPPPPLPGAFRGTSPPDPGLLLSFPPPNPCSPVPRLRVWRPVATLHCGEEVPAERAGSRAGGPSRRGAPKGHQQERRSGRLSLAPQGAFGDSRALGTLLGYDGMCPGLWVPCAPGVARTRLREGDPVCESQSRPCRLDRPETGFRATPPRPRGRRAPRPVHSRKEHCEGEGLPSARNRPALGSGEVEARSAHRTPNCVLLPRAFRSVQALDFPEHWRSEPSL